MEAENTNERLVRFLLELVRGQWNSIPEDTIGKDTYGEADEGSVTQMVKLLADELRELFLHHAFVNPHIKYQFIEYGIFYLDDDFTIRSFNYAAARFLDINPARLYKSDFTALLTSTSGAVFAREITEKQASHYKPQPLELHFNSLEGLPVRADCFLSKLLYGKHRWVVSLYGLQPFEHIEKRLEHHAKNSNVAQQVYELILSHQHGPLPSARELARRLGTNEYELKKTFKSAFGTSIYQCYMQQRLKKAYALIRETDMALLDIAGASGFDEYTGFAKAFRKHYGMSPAKAREAH